MASLTLPSSQHSVLSSPCLSKLCLIKRPPTPLISTVGSMNCLEQIPEDYEQEPSLFRNTLCGKLGDTSN